jgi:hypothetical protein
MYSDILTFNLEFSKTKFFNINNGIPLEKPVNVPSGVSRNFFGGGGTTNSVEDRGQRERGSGGVAP